MKQTIKNLRLAVATLAMLLAAVLSLEAEICFAGAAIVVALAGLFALMMTIPDYPEDNKRIEKIEYIIKEIGR